MKSVLFCAFVLLCGQLITIELILGPVTHRDHQTVNAPDHGLVLDLAMAQASEGVNQ